jgi:hypothetical protein
MLKASRYPHMNRKYRRHPKLWEAAIIPVYKGAQCALLEWLLVKAGVMAPERQQPSTGRTVSEHKPSFHQLPRQGEGMGKSLAHKAWSAVKSLFGGAK